MATALILALLVACGLAAYGWLRITGYSEPQDADLIDADGLDAVSLCPRLALQTLRSRSVPVLSLRPAGSRWHSWAHFADGTDVLLLAAEPGALGSLAAELLTSRAHLAQIAQRRGLMEGDERRQEQLVIVIASGAHSWTFDVEAIRPSESTSRAPGSVY